jgi:RNA polymerase sigma factor (sigma-70 family)
VEIWKQVERFTSTDPPAANPEFLKATITGAFNKILLHVRDHLCYRRGCKRGEANKLVVPEEWRAPSNDDSPLVINSREGVLLARRLDGSRERIENKLRVEQAIRHLEDDERKVFELVKYDGHTQQEAAEMLQISQPTVSRLHNSAIKKLRNILGPK